MKLLIDTEKKTIEIYGGDIELEEMPLLAPFAVMGYTVIRVPEQVIIGTVSEIKYHTNKT